MCIRDRFVLMCLLVKRCLPGDVLSFLIGVVFGYMLDVCRLDVYKRQPMTRSTAC